MRPDETVDCYGGPPGTEGVGLCAHGTQTCAPDGGAFGPCEGEILPLAADDCATPGDDDCDGTPNDDCICTPGDVVACYDGPAGTEGVGPCMAGTQVCDAGGQGFGACASEVLPAPESCASTVDENCDGRDCVDWASIYGDSSSQFGNAVAVDGTGNVIVAGYFFGSLKIGGQTLIGSVNSEIFVAKFSPAGAPLWAIQFGDASGQRALAVATNAQGKIALTGYDQGATDFGGGAAGPGIFVVLLDANGTHLWSRGLGGTNPGSTGSAGAAVTFDAAGNVLVAGAFQGSITAGPVALTSAGGNDAFLAKLSAASGTGLWSQRYGDAAAQGAQDVAIDGAGNVLLAATVAGAADFGGGALTSSGSNDVVVAKFDGNGNHSWSKRFGDAASQVPQALAADAQGNPVVVGYFGGTVDFGGGPLSSTGGTDVFVAKLSNVGSHQWSAHYGDAQDQTGVDAAVDPGGSVFLTGNFNGSVDFGLGALTSAGQRDAFVVRLGTQGTPTWSRRYGGALDDAVATLALASMTSESVLCGGIQGTVDFGVGPLAAAGGFDLFLLHLSP